MRFRRMHLCKSIVARRTVAMIKSTVVAMLMRDLNPTRYMLTEVRWLRAIMRHRWICLESESSYGY